VIGSCGVVLSAISNPVIWERATRFPSFDGTCRLDPEPLTYQGDEREPWSSPDNITYCHCCAS
jgi:hypothetical protein